MKNGLSPLREVAPDGLPAKAAPASSAPGVPVQSRSVALTVLAVIGVVFALHWAQAVLIPLMLAVMISYTLSGPVKRLQE